MRIKHVGKVMRFSSEVFDKTPGTGLEYGRSQQPRVHQATWEASAPKQARLLQDRFVLNGQSCLWLLTNLLRSSHQSHEYKFTRNKQQKKKKRGC